MKKIHDLDYIQMTPKEKEIFFYSTVGIQQGELARIMAEFEWETGKKPNALFLSYKLLAKIPGRIKKCMGMTVIPMDSKEDEFSVSEVDPWDKRWEHLFFS